MKKIVTIWLALAMICSVRAFAQAPYPPAEREWQKMLNDHPGLRQHPEWLGDPTYMNQHPKMTRWLNNHPLVYKQARSQGMWDQQGTWRDPSWWHENDADSMYRYHPDWAQRNRDWDNDRREWAERHNEWVQHHRDWVERHPEWANRGDNDEEENEGPPGHAWGRHRHDGPGKHRGWDNGHRHGDDDDRN